jgi:hypothetical protein
MSTWKKLEFVFVRKLNIYNRGMITSSKTVKLIENFDEVIKFYFRRSVCHSTFWPLSFNRCQKIS